MNDPFQTPPGQQPPFGAAPTNGDYGLAPELATGSPAGFWIRAAARFIDTLAGMALGLVSGALGPTIVALMGHHLSGRMALFTPGKLALTFVGPILYHSIAESMGGATLGKLACGLRVVGEDFRPASLGATVIRSVSYFVDAFCFAIVAYLSMQGSSLQQRLGDKWAHTIVVRVASPGRAVFPGIGIGLAAWLMTQLVGWVFVGS